MPGPISSMNPAMTEGLDRIRMNNRTERDTLGAVEVPEDAYFGAGTQRAVENFPVSGLRFPPTFIHSLAIIKKFAARVNADLGLLEQKLASAIATGKSGKILFFQHMLQENVT